MGGELREAVRPNVTDMFQIGEKCVCVCVCVCMCVCHFVRGRNLIHDCRTYVVPSMCVWNSKTLMHCQCSFYFNPPQSQ